MISAKVDQAKLERSLKKAAKGFGDSSAQAVIRLGVSVCRDLAVQTQAWGGDRYGGIAKKDRPTQSRNGPGFIDTSFAKGVQEGAIVADAFNVISIVKSVGPNNKRGLRSAGEVNDWIELNRTKRRGRTAKLAKNDRKVCTAEVFKKAMRVRFLHAGMAKGGWIGAGNAIASHQTGGDRIPVGRNFLNYAKKFSSFGSAKPAKSGWSPVAELHNGVRHVGSDHVLSAKSKKDAIFRGLQKTLKWYNQAAKAALDKA